MIYLTKKQIIRLNEATILEHGGNFLAPCNFLHESNLDYLIEAVQSEMFGQELYPSIFEKAGLYCFNIICNHIFTDGNKRTGLASAQVFLNLNNYDLREAVTNQELTDFILKIASGNSSLPECQEWFKTNIIKL